MIPFNIPAVAPNQLRFVDQVFQSGHLSGDGTFTKSASDLLSQHHLGSPALLTTSCTSALEMSAILLDLKPGDEVIVPCFTFVSTANAFALMGARVIFADIDEGTLNIDFESLKLSVSDRTRAVVVVNYGGVSAITGEMIDFCLTQNIVLIEDNAHGLFGKQDDIPLGTRSAMSTLSFHETKNVTCGEGGALIVNDRSFFDRAEIIREKGTDRSRFFRGMVDKYTWVDKGSSYLMSEINAAVLLAQLQFFQSIQHRRKQIIETYEKALNAWASENTIRLQEKRPNSLDSAHLFCLKFKSHQEQRDFIAHMKRAGIATPFHYVPLCSSPAGRTFGHHSGECKVSRDVSERLVRLPVYYDLSDDQLELIVQTVCEFLPK